jgi:hypothetical protein
LPEPVLRQKIPIARHDIGMMISEAKKSLIMKTLEFVRDEKKTG